MAGIQPARPPHAFNHEKEVKNVAEENREMQELTRQELSEQNKIRREKLAQMQEEGHVPFQIVRFDVTHHCDAIRADFDALEVKVVAIAVRLMS